MGINYKEDIQAFVIDDINKTVSKLKPNAMKAVVYEEIKGPDGKKFFERFNWNNTLIGGTQLNAMSVFGLPDGVAGSIKIHTFDEESGINLLTPTAIDNAKPEVFGWLFSLDGASLSTVNPVLRSGKGFAKAGVIPMRMIPVEEDDGSLFTNYECRSVEDGYAKYYVKKPTSIKLINMTVDGDVLEDYPDVSLGDTVDVVTAVEVIVDLTTDDMREYFAIVEGDVSSRRFSGISVMRGTPVSVESNGIHTEHRGMMCTQRINGKDRNLEKYNTGKYIMMIYYT